MLEKRSWIRLINNVFCSKAIIHEWPPVLLEREFGTFSVAGCVKDKRSLREGSQCPLFLIIYLTATILGLLENECCYRGLLLLTPLHLKIPISHFQNQERWNPTSMFSLSFTLDVRLSLSNYWSQAHAGFTHRSSGLM